MFENILGHETLVDELTRNVKEETLPASLLFHGPELCGKLTTALELARVLMCARKSAEWQCGCRSCEQNRLLENPYLLLLGSRSFMDEIRAAADVFRKSDISSTRLFFIRAVRKLEKRFDGLLWEGAESRIAQLFGAMEELEETLEAILRGVPEGTLEETADKVVELSSALNKKIASDSVPVNQIRKASYWAHTTAGDSPKVIIIENVDRMLPGSRNALLKILEEPPSNTYFILIAARKEGVMPTLKSRLRQLQFLKRSREAEAEILRRVFREPTGGHESLREYFLLWSADPGVVKETSSRFLASITEVGTGSFFSDSDSHGSIPDELKDPRVFKAFLTELSNRNREAYHLIVETNPPDHHRDSHSVWH